MVRGTEQHRLLRTSLGDGSSNPVQRGVHFQVQPVVEVPVGLFVPLVDTTYYPGRAVARVVGVFVGHLGGRLGRKVLVAGRWLGHRWRVGLSGFQGVVSGAAPGWKQDDVVWVHEAGHQQKRPLSSGFAGPTPGVPVLQPGNDPVGNQRIAHHPAVGQQRTVGFGAYPAGKAEGVQRIGLQISPDRPSEHLPAGSVGGQRTAGRRVDEVGVAHMPFAVVVGVVSSGPEPVAQRRYLSWS